MSTWRPTYWPATYSGLLSGREDESGSATGASGGLTETLLREQGFV